MLKFIKRVFIGIIIGFILLIPGYFIHWYYFTFDGIDYRIHKIYDSLIVQTGQSQDRLPLFIVNEDYDNAYNNGQFIVMYTGFIKRSKSEDEIALFLGHEIAHGFLGHLELPLKKLSPGIISMLESNADKMGAVYMMKAGYDVCKGRERFKYWRAEQGNYLNQDHPDYSYRYDELNIGCE